MVIQEPIQAAIWNALNQYAYSDAIFLAERLYAEVGTDEGLFLLATSYYRSGSTIRALGLLKQHGCPNAQCSYLMAQCCMQINKFAEAEAILSGRRSYDEIVEEFGDTACFAFKLLGNIYEKSDQHAKSAENYLYSLKLNPFLWSSFESLCNLGERPNAKNIFRAPASQTISRMCQNACHTPHSSPMPSTPVMSADLMTPNSHIDVKSSQRVSFGLQDAQPVTISSLQTPQIISYPQEGSSPSLPLDSAPNTTPRPLFTHSGQARKPRPRRTFLSGLANLSPLSPSFGVLLLEQSPVQSPIPPVQPLVDSTYEMTKPHRIAVAVDTQRCRTTPGGSFPPKQPVFLQSGNTNVRELQTTPQPGLQSSNNVPVVRRSSRLFSNASSSVKENNESQSQKKFTTPKAPAKKSKTRSSKTSQELNELNKSELLSDIVKSQSANMAHAQMVTMQRQSVDGLMTLLQNVGAAYLALQQYNCKQALELFLDLPPHHLNTGWVNRQIGKAYFELANYKLAEKSFAAARVLEPYCVKGMDLYSTTLWHLQKEILLSALAQELHDIDRNAPETWCAVGNCLSLEKEHDLAIMFFKRAVQVDPNFAYAYTLLGHEFVLTEELDRAMACFRNAIRVNARHYNAWYGIGLIYYKQEKFALARAHYCRALTITEASTVLLCHLAVVEHCRKKSDIALAILNRAIEKDPLNPLCKFHRATILFGTERSTEALAELEQLKLIVPKESLVYFLMGKVYKKLGLTHLALMNFSWAMDLDPKGTNNQIKEAIDKSYVTDEDEPSLNTDTEEDGLAAREDSHDSSNNSSIVEGVDMQLDDRMLGNLI